jgi:signal transduction histidine kinase
MGYLVYSPEITVIFFFYGLAFFSMGLALYLEADRAREARLRLALLYLAIFGLLHGAHEWLEMFQSLGLVDGFLKEPLLWQSLRVGLLAFSFLPLGAFGATLVTTKDKVQRFSRAVPLVLLIVWGTGLLIMRDEYSSTSARWLAADVWTRYTLAVPSAILAGVALVVLYRRLRALGFVQYGRYSLWAAIAFFLYGLVGQVFVGASELPPSTTINQDLFYSVFGFPIQLLRAVVAIGIAFSMIRLLRLFEVEAKRQVAELQATQLEEARRREEQRGEILKRVVAAQEAERKRIARELHDETGQALTAIGLGLRAVALNIRRDIDKALGNVRQLEGLVTRSLDELRRLISDLHPTHLDDLGIAAALRWYAGEVQARAPLKVEVMVVGDPCGFPSPMETGLFRIAQEALTNVVKHADATEVEVQLIYETGTVKLIVEDNGCGFDPQVLAMDASRPSWGLAGMEERARELGGTLKLNTEPGKGTSVKVAVPCPGKVEGVHVDTTAAGG